MADLTKTVSVRCTGCDAPEMTYAVRIDGDERVDTLSCECGEAVVEHFVRQGQGRAILCGPGPSSVSLDLREGWVRR